MHPCVYTSVTATRTVQGVQTIKFLHCRMLQIRRYQLHVFAHKYQTSSRFLSTVKYKNSTVPFGDRSKEAQSEVDFDNVIDTYSSKKTSEILRAWFCLKLSSYDLVVDNFEKLVSISRRLLGRKLFEGLMKKTVYGQFAGGEDEPAVQAKMLQLQRMGIKTLLSYAMESNDSVIQQDINTREREYEQNTNICLESIDLAGRGNAVAVKLSAVCDPIFLISLSKQLAPFFTKAEKPANLSVELFSEGFNQSVEKSSVHIPSISKEENHHLGRVLKRLDAFGQRCCSKGVKLYVDAEWGYFAPAIHHLTLALQYKYNRQKPCVFNTYQCYKKNTYDLLKADLSLIDKLGFQFGAKFVRGAYMEGERSRALKMGYLDPINESFNTTTDMYHRCVDTVLDRVTATCAEVTIASQNEETVQWVIGKMQELGIPPNSTQVSFAQTYGMVDHISIALGAKGYSVYKLLEYGSVDSLITWLCRRAYENKPTVQRTARERQLLWQELTRRMRTNSL